MAKEGSLGESDELSKDKSEEMVMIAFKLPPKLKRALALVAADKGEGVTISSLLRTAVVEIVSSHRGGYFFKLDALSKEQDNFDPKAVGEHLVIELPQAG